MQKYGRNEKTKQTNKEVYNDSVHFNSHPL